METNVCEKLAGNSFLTFINFQFINYYFIQQGGAPCQLASGNKFPHQ